MMDVKSFIAARIAKELRDGNIVNLGIGLPTLIPNFLPEGVKILLQSENGFIGIGPTPGEGRNDPYIVNAGGAPASILPEGAFFNSADSFGIIRGGHVDVTVLGALQVDEKGNLANWIIPGKMVPGMGGAMDLVVGAKEVIIAMEHTNKGRPKILKECTLPLTAVSCVDMIVTERCVLKVTPEGLLLTEYNEHFTLEQILQETEAKIIVANDIKPMAI